MRRISVSLFCAVLVAACGGSGGPTSDDLKTSFSLSLPSVWSVAEFAKKEQENLGTKTAPDVRTRFSAKLKLAQDIYVVKGVLGTTAVLALDKKAGDVSIEVFGIARSKLQSEKWVSSFELENPGAIGLESRPLAAFGTAYVMSGSKEEKALEAKLKEEAAARMAKIEKEVAERKKAEEEAARAAREKAQALDRATAAILQAGKVLVSRYQNTRTGRAGEIRFRVERLDPVTRTFSGISEYSDQSAYRFKGSYSAGKVQIEDDEDPIRGRGVSRCKYDLALTGSKPPLAGTYFVFGRCGPGKIEVGLS